MEVSFQKPCIYEHYRTPLLFFAMLMYYSAPHDEENTRGDFGITIKQKDRPRPVFRCNIFEWLLVHYFHVIDIVFARAYCKVHLAQHEEQVIEAHFFFELLYRQLVLVARPRSPDLIFCYDK